MEFRLPALLELSDFYLLKTLENLTDFCCCQFVCLFLRGTGSQFAAQTGLEFMTLKLHPHLVQVQTCSAISNIFVYFLNCCLTVLFKLSSFGLFLKTAYHCSPGWPQTHCQFAWNSCQSYCLLVRGARFIDTDPDSLLAHSFPPVPSTFERSPLSPSLFSFFAATNSVLKTFTVQ